MAIDAKGHQHIYTLFLEVIRLSSTLAGGTIRLVHDYCVLCRRGQASSTGNTLDTGGCI
jgi:hypothetical protein